MGFNLESGKKDEVQESPKSHVNENKNFEKIKCNTDYDFSDCERKTDVENAEYKKESFELKSKVVYDFSDCEKRTDVEYIKNSVQEKEPNLEKRDEHVSEKDYVLEKENPTLPEAKMLVYENREVLETAKNRQSEVGIETGKKFDEILSKERGTEEYKQALQEYNTLKEQKVALDDSVAVLMKRQNSLEERRFELRESQILLGNKVMGDSVETLAKAKSLDNRFDKEYYREKASRIEFENIREDNIEVMKGLIDEKESLKLAMNAKMDEISEYVMSKGMGQYEASKDSRYVQKTQEYLSYKSQYDEVGYFIVKLDNNNMRISENVGDEYVSMCESSHHTTVPEVEQGKDIPHETNYFIDETRTSEVLSKFEQSEWENLSLREQKQSIEQLADYNAEILGVEEKPLIVYYCKEDLKEFGGFNPQQNAIYINEYNLNDASETVDTIAHEYRHKYQYERAGKMENERDMAFKENIDNYICAEDDYQGYKEQLIEADAREYAEVLKAKNASYETENKENMGRNFMFGEHAKPFSTLNPEKGAVWEAGNESVSEQLKIEGDKRNFESIRSRTFHTNRGELIAYEEAINRITASAAYYMDSMNVDEQVQELVVSDMKMELVKQQVEAEARGLGDHGVRHIFGNFERGENYLSSREDMSDEQKLAILVSQVYHDEGYTINPNNLGVLKEGNSDKKHDEASLEIWKDVKRQEVYKDVFTQESLEAIDIAIGRHNSQKIEEIQINTSVMNNPIVSTVHICDKLALSQREKFSELLLSNPKLVELTEGMNSVMKTFQNERLGFYEDGRLTKQGEALLERYHGEINRYIDLQGYDANYANRLKMAVEKDVGFNSGEFSSRMNYIYTPSNCFHYNTAMKRNEITIYTIMYPDAPSSDMMNKQVEKLYEDLGVPEDAIGEAILEGEYVGIERGLYVRVEAITEEEIRTFEMDKYQENDDLREVSERIELGRAKYQELSDKLIEVIKLKSGRDITYKDFRKIVHLGDKARYKCTKKKFDAYSPHQKEEIIKEIASEMVLVKVGEILK